MMHTNDEDEKDKKYLIEDEKLDVVFKETPVPVEEDEEEDAPQNKDDYTVAPTLLNETVKGLQPISISQEMRKSFLEYAMSVIVSRALPDARDGLKPVHRRILFGMHELNLTSSVAHKKSARIVGDVLGKYHPHGDSSVYEAMVRMAQDFSMRYPLVDGHGNFGSIDGDGAAAMRYTEVRMSKIAALMVDGIRKETVNFVPNYDASEIEPEVLPARIPNLLVTGSTGIAVGMATNIPPHNLSEIIDGVIALAQNSAITCDELMEYIKAPDFPTGGIILGKSGVYQAYTTGRGSIPLRSKTEVTELKNGKTRIIITEIPFTVNKSQMIEKIAQLSKDKQVEGIVDLRDETSREGLRVVIDLSRNIVPEVVLNKLFKLTSMQTTFSVNIVALVHGKPETLNLKRALEVYLEHQVEVVTRRSQFDLTKAQARAHILEGIKEAILNIDAVIKIIRESKNDAEAQTKLATKFKFSEEQAKSITDMRLGRLTGLAIEKMNEEIAELNAEITSLKQVLSSRESVINQIVLELNDIKSRFGDVRRTAIIDASDTIADEDLIPRKDVAITMSAKGYVKRIPLHEYVFQNRGGIGSNTMKTYGDDDVQDILTTHTHTDLLIFTTKGKVYRIRTHQIPEQSRQAKGTPFLNIIPVEKDETVVSMLSIEEYDEGNYLFTVTQQGVVKKTPIEEYSKINANGKIALGMRDGDMLIKAMIINDDDHIIIGSSVGKLVRFEAGQVRASGRPATGVKGIELTEGDDTIVVGASKTTQGKYVLSIGEDGYGKMTDVEEYKITNRGAKGIKSIDVSKAGQLSFVEVVNGNEDILVITKSGTTIRTNLSQLPISSRDTKGVKLITLRDDDLITSIAVMDIAQVVDEASKKNPEVHLNFEDSI